MARDRIRGCLLAGAVGDALGAPVEFLRLDEIRGRYGPCGVASLERGEITDDTQMTLFTAEGLIRSYVRWSHRGISHPPSVVHRAYLRWLATQGDPLASVAGGGWLFEVQGLHARRAPGNTCLSALRSGEMGAIEKPLNDSKGCGGVMRAAPAGLANVSDPFGLGAEIAAITHGHPSGYLPAGFLAALVARDPTAERVESLGGGWVGEEALAIAVYCALAAPDLRAALLLAVNHSGDSDSTGAIAGNILGALHGEAAIPVEWLARTELRDVIQEVADDLADAFYGEGVGDEYTYDERVKRWLARYPGG